MQHNCLYCYESLPEGIDFHEQCSRKIFGTKIAPKITYTLDQMDELAKSVVERSVSVPGVQAKLSMSLVKSIKQKSDARLTVVDALGGQYIFKPPSEKFVELPENEHLTMRVAEAFGLRVVPSSLIRLASGERSYITKRIDRTSSGGKIHMLDMFQITEAYDKYKSSMEKVGKALDAYSSNPLLDKILLFELTVFSFLVGNNDMHLKNFSMIESASGWILAPAYDLLNATIINPDDDEELALNLCGKKRKLNRDHFDQFAEKLGLNTKQRLAAFTRFSKHKRNATNWIDRSFLSEEMKMAYLNLIETRYKRLAL
ncbi:MAG: HipA domain-containing protein [Bacteroidales bacterium]|nr:HipA domain-containing protein [Bacteroidales bacterium]